MSFKSDKIKVGQYTIDELFSTPDKWARLHDVMVECGMGSPTLEEARQVFFELPAHVKEIAYNWGIGDTVFGDETYDHLQSIGVK